MTVYPLYNVEYKDALLNSC